MWQILAILVLVLGIWLHWMNKHGRMLKMSKLIPGPPALPIIGNAFIFMVQPQEFVNVIKDLMVQYGDVFRIWLGTDLNVVVSNPDDVKTLLTHSKATFKGPQYKYMTEVIGQGILSGSGTLWRKHRKIAAPNYGKRAITGYTDVMNSEVDLLLQRYKEIPKGQQTDINEFIVQTTSYVVCQTLFGLRRSEMLELPHLQFLIEKTPELYKIIFDRMIKWYLQLDPLYWLTNHYALQKDFAKKTREFSETVLKYRLERLKSVNETDRKLINSEEDSIDSTQLSVIDRFLLSQELDPIELLDETFTVFTSSQEASAKIASTTLLMLAYHPKCQEKLYAEIVSVMDNKDKPVNYDDLRKMPYLEMVFKEVIRLFPIGGMLQRSLTEDIPISSCTLPAGSSLVVPIFHMHRDPRHWPNPDAFDPERFSPENMKTRNPFCYIPFSLGSMDCLGRYYASQLVKVIVVRVLLNFKLTAVDKYEDLGVKIEISTATMNGHPAILTLR